MLKPAVTVSLFFVPLLAASASYADTVTTEADTLVVVTPNAPIVVQQGAPTATVMAPGAAEMPPPPPPGYGPSAVAPAPATANGAPQNEDWNNVNHINGIPVKVGEKQDYMLTVKKNNIAANPFGLFFGLYDISVARSLSRNVAASFAFTGTDEFYQLSATLPLYFRKTFSGPFLEGGLLIRSTKDYYYADCYDCSNGSYEMSTTWTGPQMMFGWHWTFDSGLNVAFAGGVAKRMTHQSEYGGSNTEGNAYFRVGYAF
ncbi:MAG TPA: hypothetical protein VL326_03545 [Kofleriaceae bacterium]|nr:hypothetical protein [Kofleriaceae bacterium]